MLISLHHHLIFLAYPRTGSRTIHALLEPYADISGNHLSKINDSNPFHHHMSAREVIAVVEKKGMQWSDYRSFCVVRNPFARLLSLYHRRVEHETRWDARIRPISNIYSFFIRDMPGKLWFSLFVLTRNSARGFACNLQAFAFDENGNQLVTDLIRFEHLHAEVSGFFNGLGIPVSESDIPHLNRSVTDGFYKNWYSDLTKRRVQSLYKFELDRFDYHFD